MPHTNRKNKGSDPKPRGGYRKKFAHSRREFLEDNEGWTHVANKGWKSGMKNDGQLPGGELSPSADMTLEEMTQEHSRYENLWKTSEAYVQLKKLLLDDEKVGRKDVNNVVCLGLGSLQALSLEWRQSSHTQLAALTTIKETLNLAGQIIMQDPRFTGLDKLFLTSIGSEVVEDPNAFLRINESSVVYAIHCPFHIFSKIKEKAYPALLISNDFRVVVFNEPDLSESAIEKSTEMSVGQLPGPERGSTNEAKNGSKYYNDTLSLIEDCEETPFPQLRWDFSDTLMYWRRPQQTKDN